MNTKKYLDFAFETAADTIDVGAFKPEEALQFIITGMKAYAKRNGYEFTEEEIKARALKGIKELGHAEADFDEDHRADSVNAEVPKTEADYLDYAFQYAASTLDLGAFKPEEALQFAVTSMKDYAKRNGHDLKDEDIKARAKKGIAELDRAAADFYADHRADSVNAPIEETKEDHLEYAFESVANTINLSSFAPKEALQFAVTGMKAYAYDNGYTFTEEEILEKAKSGIKELQNAAVDYAFLNWSMPR